MASRWQEVRAARAKRRALNVLAVLALGALVAVAAGEWQAFEVTRAVVTHELGRMP